MIGDVCDPKEITSAFVGAFFHPSGDAFRISTMDLYKSTTLERSTVSVSESGLRTHVDSTRENGKLKSAN